MLKPTFAPASGCVLPLTSRAVSVAVKSTNGAAVHAVALMSPSSGVTVPPESDGGVEASDAGGIDASAPASAAGPAGVGVALFDEHPATSAPIAIESHIEDDEELLTARSVPAPGANVPAAMSEEHALHAFRAVPRTGVIYVTSEAVKSGFSMGDAEWCNLGQGQPETGELPGAPPRVRTVAIHVDDQEYAPVAGLWELRETIASLYNALYRRGLPSQYSAENVAVSGGGRASLTRAAASLGSHQPRALPPRLHRVRGAARHLQGVHRHPDPPRAGARLLVHRRRPSARDPRPRPLRASPVEPVQPHRASSSKGTSSTRWVETARELDCALLLDEFYSHYVYRPRRGALPIESAARYVEDVDRDPVLILDGLTKNWRYPGWRVTWSIGPKQVIEAVASAGSFLDGGGSKPLQRAAIPLLEEAHVTAETMAVHTVFREKRDFLLSRLERLGVRFDRTPDGTFYCWGSVAGLPPSMSDGMSFFRAALEHKVITVPGEFFDVNPGKRRSGRASRFRDYVRFSFGPSLATLEKAVARFEAMVATASS